MRKQKLKFKKLMNEYRSESYELEYIDEVLKDANSDFEVYLQGFIAKKQIKIDELKKKHATRLEKVFSISLGVTKSIKNLQRQGEYDSKDLFRQIAKKFHPDTLPLGDPRQEEYEEIFKKAANAIQESKWGELFDLAEKYDLDMDDYDQVIKSLKIDIERVRDEIRKKKDTYAWILYECENNYQKDEVIKRFLNYVYIDYYNIT